MALLEQYRIVGEVEADCSGATTLSSNATVKPEQHVPGLIGILGQSHY